MNRVDPPAREVAVGLTGAGPSQRAYLSYLALQALAVFLTWPTGGVHGALQRGGGPDTLLVALVACGLATAYHAIRTGADELVLPGQHSLRDWLHATPLAPWRILRGYLLGRALQTLHAIALSAPLLLAALAVSGGEWPALGWALAMIALQAIAYGLAAAAIYLAIGHRAGPTFLAVRAVPVAGYAGAILAWPAASQPMATARLLREGVGSAGGEAAPDHLTFLIAYTLACAMLALALLARLRRERAVQP